MGLTQTAAQQATAIASAQAAKLTAKNACATSDGPDRAVQLAEITKQDALERQARESKTTG